MDEKFLEVMQHEGPATIVTINGNPASVVNTWMSYIEVDPERKTLLIPAAGMHSIEGDFAKDNTVTITVGTKEVEGTEGPGAGFHVYGKGRFIDDGEDFERMKSKFEWIRKVLVIDVTDMAQKI